MVTAVGRRSTLRAPRMSDMSDMTIEMLKRVEKTLGELPETELIRVCLGSCQTGHSAHLTLRVVANSLRKGCCESGNIENRIQVISICYCSNPDADLRQ